MPKLALKAADRPTKAWPHPRFRELLVQRILAGEHPSIVMLHLKPGSPMAREVLARVEEEKRGAGGK